MAIAKGRESFEALKFKKYIGVCPVFVKAVNPDKKTYEELYNVALDEEISYTGVVTDNDGNEIPNARISIILQPDNEKVGFEMPLITMALFIQNRARYNKDNTKVQVIDKYGRTAWATIDEAKNHKIPTDKNSNPLNIDKDYRPAYIGEEELVKFIKAYLCIPNIQKYDNSTKTWILNSDVNPEECECRLDNLDKIFKGDFSEITEALTVLPNNKVKVMLGVRNDIQSGRVFQAVYTKEFLTNSSSSYSTLEKRVQEDINNAMQNGRTLNSEFKAIPVQEYSIISTSFTQQEASPINEAPYQETSTGLPWDN